MRLSSIVFLLAFCLHSIRGQDDERVEVKTKYGTVRGRVLTAENGAKVNQFLGIPYAAPPVGDLRFKKTQPPENFPGGTFDADKMPPACMQYSEQPYPWYDSGPGQSENCLYLNIWAPADSSMVYPVRMYVHGGGWFEGGSNRMGYYDGFGEAVSTFYENGTLNRKGMVVVTVNYRLGAFGFLSSGKIGDASGNMGLFDLVQAYWWLISEMKAFNGYVGQTYDMKWNYHYGHYYIDLVGQGSGAIAVSLMRTATTQVGMVSRATLDGASLLTLKALPGVDAEGDPYLNNLRLTDLLAQKVGCRTSIKDNAEETIQCLRGVEASELVRAAASLSADRGPPNVFLPQLKGPDRFFNYNPYMALHEFALKNPYTLVTFTSDEGSNLLTNAFPNVFGEFGEKDVPLSAKCARKAARKFLQKFPASVVDRLLRNLDDEPSVCNRAKVIRAIGDAYFNCPLLYYAEEMKGPKVDKVDNSWVFMLEKQVSPPFRKYAEWMGSVDFDNVQADFYHPDRKLNVNNQTYEYTDEQMEQARVRMEQQAYYEYSGAEGFRAELQLAEFNLTDRAYSVLRPDGQLETKSDFHRRNCDILRPYFMYSNCKENNFWLKNETNREQPSALSGRTLLASGFNVKNW